jgi:hypothetical protein
MAVQVGSFHFPESWLDMRDLGAVLDYEEPCPIQLTIKCRSVAGSSGQRRQASAQSDEDIAPAKFEGHHEAALGSTAEPRTYRDVDWDGKRASKTSGYRDNCRSPLNCYLARREPHQPDYRQAPRKDPTGNDFQCGEGRRC